MHHAQLTTDYWTRLQGIRLGGAHELREWIGDDGTHRYFLIHANDRVPRNAIIAVVAGDNKSLESQLTHWNNARAFDHRNLVRVYDTGYDEIEGQPVVYAVMEHPDEDLGSVTLGRALTVEEATEVGRALVSALQYLHGRGFVHGKVDPFSIVAIGDSIKLVTHDASAASPELIAADISALGFTLCQLLSKKVDNALISSKALPQPFDAIVRGCTQRGWNLRQVERALEGLPAEPEMDAVSEPRPPAAPALRMEQQAQRLEAEAPPGNRMMWVAGAAAAGIIGAVLYVATAGGEPKKAAVSTQTPEQKQRVVNTTVQTASVSPARVAAPAVIKPREPADWRVIAYTYSSRQGAEERAKRIRTRWPDLHPEVYAPGSGSGPYLVSLGGVMTRSDAMRLRAKARANGLPRDTFARNFK